MKPESRYSRQVSNERPLAPYIPYSSHWNGNTIITKDGDLIRIWKVDGISFETVDDIDIGIKKNQLNTLLRSIGQSEHVAIWTHDINRRVKDRLEGFFENNFAKEIDKKYYESFDGYKMMANELYLTLVYRPRPSMIDRKFIKAERRTIEEIKKDISIAERKLDELARQIEAGLNKDYQLEALTSYEDENKVLCSHALTFLNYLISGEWQKIRIPKSPLNEYLGSGWVFVGTETIEIRTATKRRFAQVIDFKDYNAHTEPGILNGLLYENYEFVITQSFTFMSKHKGKEFLERQRNQLLNTEDGGVTQIEEINFAIDQLIDGQFVMGDYHYSLMVYGDSIDDLNDNVGSAMAVIQNQGFIASLVTTATDAAFYAQLPCNWSYRPRLAGLTSRNFAGLQSFHNFRSGKRDGNPWGEAISILKTPSGQPLYLNFHYAKGDEDSYDKKVLGNTRIIGQAGTGKTVLMVFLLLQLQKYKHRSPTGFTVIFFDKDEGAKLAIKAMGGKYLSVKNGLPTGFNPFQMDTSEDNILFLEKLVRVLASSSDEKVTTSDEMQINHAVRTVMRMPKEYRRLSIVLQNIQEGGDRKEKESSLHKRLSKWCLDDGQQRRGQFWWVFDNPNDEIDFTTHSNYGIDGTDFLDNSDVRTPISLYLLHRMEKVIDGRRFVYFMDEAWKWVDDSFDAFADFAGDKQTTIRKKNGLGVFATQMPSQLLKSKIAAQLVQQVATEIYLPNPKADYKEYSEGFKVSDAEFLAIRDFQEDSRMFVIKQGHSSMIGMLDLNGFDDELAIMSGSTDNNALVDEIIAEVGDEPELWMPIFHKRRKERAIAEKKTKHY